MDKYLTLHLILGPLILIIAVLFKKFPPGKINSLYGYRTPRSTRSQDAWACANRFSANALLIVAGLTCVFQVIAYSLMSGMAAIQWSSGFMVVGLLATIPLTEAHLRKRGH